MISRYGRYCVSSVVGNDITVRSLPCVVLCDYKTLTVSGGYGVCAVWYQASQICAVLSVILLMPALVAGTLYSYVVSLSGRSRASWVLIAFLAAVGQCAR